MDALNKYYYITYYGDFAFIKPHHATRCNEIYSQHFLTSSHLRGLQDEHGVKISNILLNFDDFLPLQTQTESIKVTEYIAQEDSKKKKRGRKKVEKEEETNSSILKRHFLRNVEVTLLFDKEEEYRKMKDSKKHIYVGDSDYLLFPTRDSSGTITLEEFHALNGFQFVEDKNGICFGYDFVYDIEIFGYVKEHNS